MTGSGRMDDAAGARAVEEFGWHDVRTRVFEGVRGVACRARAVWARDGRDGQ